MPERGSQDQLLLEGLALLLQAVLLQQQILGWSAKAELALQKGREDLARAALTEKLTEAKKCEQLEQDQERVAEVLGPLTADSERLASKLNEAREQLKMLTLRQQTAHSRICTLVDNQRMHQLMARFDGFQGRVEHLEAATLGQNCRPSSACWN